MLPISFSKLLLLSTSCVTERLFGQLRSDVLAVSPQLSGTGVYGEKALICTSPLQQQS